MPGRASGYTGTSSPEIGYYLHMGSAASIVLVAALLGGVPASKASSVGVIAGFRAAAAAYSAQTSGYLVDRVVQTIEAKGGFIHVNRVERRAEVRKDGEIVASRDIGRHDASNVSLSSHSVGPNGHNDSQPSQRHFVFDQRFIGDYHLAPVTCPTCADGVAEVSFDSNLHDEDHGTGTALVDLRHDRILSVTYRPYMLPDRRMDSGIVTISFGRLGNAWLPVRYRLAFTAHYLFIHGSGTVDIVSESVRHYPTLEAARAAADSDTGSQLSESSTSK
ncbi:MAG: hypothetical protein JO043_04630 [Candidatus Eremiobacteraeota bacterium]|nr:hypothetical protein [Candidatus Eremiobacteraeota bacterium]